MKVVPPTMLGGKRLEKSERRSVSYSRTVLAIDLLRKLAAYVQSKHDNNMADLLASGFQAVSMNRAQSALPQPAIKEIRNGASGVLEPKIATTANANGYEAQFALVNPDGTLGDYKTGGVYSNTRDLAVTNCTPGALYSIQVRALGGSTGYSDWSDPVQHRAL